MTYLGLTDHLGVPYALLRADIAIGHAVELLGLRDQGGF